MKNINKKALLIWIGAVVLIGAGIFIYLTKAQNKTDRQDTSPPPQGWTEVSVEEDGITFSFPPDWQLSECPTGINCPENDTSIYLEIPSQHDEHETYYLQIQNILNEENMSLEELKKSHSKTSEYAHYLTDNGLRYVKIALSPYSKSTPFPQQKKFKELTDRVVESVTFSTPTTE